MDYCINFNGIIRPAYCFDTWSENEHPRDEQGRFTDGCSSEASAFLGKEFTGVKGQAAVDLLMKEKQGHVKAAFTRKDIGDIDLVWGNEDKGLCHILKRRNYPEDKKKQFLSSLSNVIEKGELSFNEKGRFEIFYDNKIAVISPDLNGDKEIKFLLTAFKQRKP